MVYTSHYLSGNLVDTLFCQSGVCVVSLEAKTVYTKYRILCSQNSNFL